MARLDTFFNEYILPNILLIQLIFKGEYNQQILLLENVMKLLDEHHRFLENKYKAFEKFKKDIIQNKSKQSEILESIKNANKSYTYAEVPEELRELLGDYVNSRKHLDKIEIEFNNLIEILPNFIKQANFIQKIIYCYKDNAFRRTTKNTSYRNFTNLDKYLSSLSLKIKFQFQSKPKINEFKKVIEEIEKIYSILNKLLSLEQNGDNFERNTDIVKYLIDLFDISTIKKITVNGKCKIVITIDEQDYFIQDIIRICKNLERKAARIFDNAQTFMLLITSYFDDKIFTKTRTQIYTTKQGCSISKLNEITSSYFNNINYKLNLIAPSVLDNDIKALQDDTDYKYFCFVYGKIKIILQNYQNDYILDFDDIKVLIEIFGTSIKGMGLDGFGEYILYYNKSQFTTFEEFINKLTTVQNRLKKCLPTTNVLLKIGKQCFECSGFFNVLRQSYLKKSEDIKLLIDEYYKKLKQAELSSEVSSTELEQKQSTIQSINNELKTIQKYAKFVNDTIYKTDSQNDYKFFNENYIQPAENILEFYQTVDEIILKNNGKGEIGLFFVSCNQTKSYYTIRHEYSCLNKSLERLQGKAESTYHSNKYIVQKKEEQKSLSEKSSQENKLSKSLYIKYLCFGALGSMLLFAFMYIINEFHIYETNNINKAENMVSKLEISEAKSIKDIKNIQQTYEQASFIINKNIFYFDQVKYNNYQYKINQAKEELKKESIALEELQKAINIGRSGINLITNKPYSLEKWEQAKSKIYSAKQILYAMSTYTFVEAQRYQKLQEYNYYYSRILARIAAEAEDSELLMTAQNTIEEVSKIVETSPHPSQTWRKAESLLMEVIPDLKDTSKDSSKRTELQKQLIRCEKFYVIVSKQVKMVEEFESTYNYGYNILQETTGIIEKYSDNFSKLQNALEQIESAISSLQTIPSNTSNYKQAQELIDTLKYNQKSIINHMKTIQSCNQAPDKSCGYENLDLRIPPSLN